MLSQVSISDHKASEVNLAEGSFSIKTQLALMEIRQQLGLPLTASLAQVRNEESIRKITERFIEMMPSIQDFLINERVSTAYMNVGPRVGKIKTPTEANSSSGPWKVREEATLKKPH